MAKINFTCTQCGRSMNLPAQYAGRLATCPQCGRTSAVPFPSAPHRPVEPLVPAQEVDSDATPSTVVRLLPALAYPFRWGGFVILLILTAGLLLLCLSIYLCGFHWSSFRRTAGIYSLEIFTAGYLCTYAVTIIKACANGEDQLPYWPDIEEYNGGIYGALFLVVAAVVLSWGPLIAYQAINLTAFAEFSLQPRDFLAHLLAAWVLFYFPMSLLAIALFESIEAVNPLLVISSIRKIPLPYLQVCSFFFLVFYLNSVLAQYLSPLGIPGLIIRVLLSVYLVIVALRILGLTYLDNARKLNWEV